MSTAKRYFGTDQTLTYIALDTTFDYPSFQYNDKNELLFLIESHTKYLNGQLFRNNLRLSDVPVPSRGNCMFISSERAETRDINADGSTLRQNVITALTDNSNYNSNYVAMYLYNGGTYQQFQQDLNRLVNSSPSFWNSALFDLIPFIISDIYQRPLMIFQSFMGSYPTMVVGPHLAISQNINVEYITIARNAILNHYENVSPIHNNDLNDDNDNNDIEMKSNYDNIDIQSHGNNHMDIISSDMDDNSNNNDKTKYKSSKFGPYITGKQFIDDNNIYLKNKYDTPDFLWWLYVALIHYQRNKKKIFKELIDNNKHNKLSRCVHYILSSITNRINKPTSETKKRALKKATYLNMYYQQELTKCNNELQQHCEWYSSNCNDIQSSESQYCTNCQTDQIKYELYTCSSNKNYLICPNCHSFFNV